MTAELVRSAMAAIGMERQVILCCDRWYPKDCVKRLVDEYPNLVIIHNARVDMTLYELPIAKTGKKGVQEYGESACR